MKRCSNCNHAWNNRKPNPEQCPHCHARIGQPAKNPTKLVIPISLLSEEKKRNILALNKFEPSAMRSHAHGVVLGRIEVLEWLESETEKKRPTP